MPEDKKYRITNIAGVILAILALFADIFTLIPFVGDFVGPIFWVLASFYFWKNGMGIVNGKRGLTTIISTVAELIPGVQELPTIFAGILIILATTRIEDKAGISVGSMAGSKPGVKMSVNGRREAPPKIPVNKGNVRPPNGGLEN